MKTINYLLIILITCISNSCKSQNTISSNKEFVHQFFMNRNVFYALKKYADNDSISILDVDKKITTEFLTFNNNGLKISIIPKKEENYDFVLKKVIINENLAFVVLWYKDSTTALCFYPFKSEYTPNSWNVEEITTRSIK